MKSTAQTEPAETQGQELHVSLSASTIKPGEPVTVTAWVTINNEITQGSSAIRYLTVSAFIRQPDGTGFSKALFDNGLEGDERSGDGKFTCRIFPSAEGEFSLNVVAEGKGLKKSSEHKFSVSAVVAVEKPSAETASQQGTETEAAHDTGSGGISWTIFIGVNLAALAVWTALFVLVYMRMKRRPAGTVEMGPAAFSEAIRQEAAETLRRLASDSTAGASTSDAKVIGEMQGARQLFLKAVAEPDKIPGDTATALWKMVYNGFDNALKTVLKGKKTALDEIDDLHEKIEEIGTLSDELKETQALVDSQSRKISFLMGFKDVIAESREKFENISKKNKELEQKLYEAAHASGMAESMKGPIDELQENYRQLELCVSTLERENERLVEEVIKWKKEFEQAAGSQQAGGLPTEEREEIQTLKDTISRLEASLEAKEKELKDLQKTFESLEAEYMVLYQEKQANNKQPDI